MPTTNPYDDLSKNVIRRAKKIDKALSAGIEIAQRLEIPPGPEPMVFKVFVDERLIPVYVSETEHPVEHNRRGRWITVREI